MILPSRKGERWPVVCVNHASRLTGSLHEQDIPERGQFACGCSSKFVHLTVSTDQRIEPLRIPFL